MHHVENLNGSVSYGGAETLTKAVDAVLRRRSRDFANLLDDLEAHINDRNAEGRTIAMFASANGNADAVRVLHGRGAKLNVQDDDGLTAVHFAVLSGDLDTLRAVVSCGGPVSTSSFCMDTPLHYAADIGRCVDSTLERCVL
jgi:ankyrin repeat protein